MPMTTRAINILDIYAYQAVKAIIKSKTGLMLYEGPSLNTPYELCKRYTIDHFYDDIKQTIEIILM